MRKIILGIVLLSISILNALDLMTEDYPPYNYTNEKGLPTGISVDIVKDTIKKTGDKDNITIVPWARSYHDIQIKKNQVLFVMTRTKQRENLFKWVGPVASNDWVMYANKKFGDTITNLEQLKNSKYIIGTYKDDACELYLKQKGFTNISSVPNDNLNVKKLSRNRIDLWIVGEYQGYIKAKRFGLEKNIKKVFKVKHTTLYIAFSKDVDDSIIQQWQKELDEMKQDGRYQTILNKYLK